MKQEFTYKFEIGEYVTIKDSDKKYIVKKIKFPPIDNEDHFVFDDTLYDIESYDGSETLTDIIQEKLSAFSDIIAKKEKWHFGDLQDDDSVYVYRRNDHKIVSNRIKIYEMNSDYMMITLIGFCNDGFMVKKDLAQKTVSLDGQEFIVFANKDVAEQEYANILRSHKNTSRNMQKWYNETFGKDGKGVFQR